MFAPILLARVLGRKQDCVLSCFSISFNYQRKITETRLLGVPYGLSWNEERRDETHDEKPSSG